MTAIATFPSDNNLRFLCADRIVMIPMIDHIEAKNNSHPRSEIASPKFEAARAFRTIWEAKYRIKIHEMGNATNIARGTGFSRTRRGLVSVDKS
jgi:hypothetical protein